MSELILPRRGFLAGLGSLILAPSVVKASSLMPVGNIDHILYPMRGLIDYNIGTDSLMVRIDRANFPLSIPKHCDGYISEQEIKRFFPKEILNKLIPNENENKVRYQKHISYIYNSEQFKNLKVSSWNDPGLYSDWDIPK